MNKWIIPTAGQVSTKICKTDTATSTYTQSVYFRVIFYSNMASYNHYKDFMFYFIIHFFVPLILPKFIPETLHKKEGNPIEQIILNSFFYNQYDTIVDPNHMYPSSPSSYCPILPWLTEYPFCHNYSELDFLICWYWRD